MAAYRISTKSVFVFAATYKTRMRHGRGKYLWQIGAQLSLLPVLVMRDYTPANELRYLSIVDEAIRDGHWFAFYNHGVAYADKPPLYFWLIMAGKWLTGGHRMWLLGAVTAVAALVVVNTMDRWVKDELDATTRTTATALLLTTGLFVGMAVVLRMDMLMCMFIVLALREFWKMVAAPSNCKKAQWMFPVYMFLAVFTKGPIGILVPMAASVAYLVGSRQTRLLPLCWGWRTWGVLTAAFSLWFGAVYLEGGSEYLNNLLFHQTLDRAVDAFHHKAPVYFYGISIWYSLAPWSLLVVGGFVAALHPKAIRSNLQNFFLLTGGITLCMLSCISAKLAVYALPAIPFMVYGVAMYIPRCRDSRWQRWALGIPAAMLSLSLPVVYVLATHTDNVWLHQWQFYATAYVLTLSGMYGFCQVTQQRFDLTGVIHTLAVGMLAAVFVAGWAVRSLNPYIGYGSLCEKATQLARERRLTHFYTWRLPRAENMDVYLGCPIRKIDDEAWPQCPRHTLLMVKATDAARFADRETYVVGRYAAVVF